MSIAKKLAHKAQAAKGATKKYFGRATGNTRLRTEGRIDQFKGNFDRRAVPGCRSFAATGRGRAR